MVFSRPKMKTKTTVIVIQYYQRAVMNSPSFPTWIVSLMMYRLGPMSDPTGSIFCEINVAVWPPSTTAYWWGGDNELTPFHWTLIQEWYLISLPAEYLIEILLDPQFSHCSFEQKGRWAWNWSNWILWFMVTTSPYYLQPLSQKNREILWRPCRFNYIKSWSDEMDCSPRIQNYSAYRNPPIQYRGHDLM